MTQVTDWLAQSYQSHSPPFSAQRAVNFFAEKGVQDAKTASPVGVWGVPGISPFVGLPEGPVLAFDIMDTRLFAVTPHAFWQIFENGAAVQLGTCGVSSNGVSIDNNGQQLVWVDGQTGWWYSDATGVQKIVDPNFFPSNTVTFFDTYFVYMRNGTRQFFLGPQNAVIPFDASLFATKEATSDLLVAIANSHEQLYLFGGERTEVWYDAGNATPAFPFQRSDGAIIQRGCIAPYSVILEDNTVFWLGEDGIFYRLDSWVPKRISDHGVEEQWSKLPTMSDCRGMTYTMEGHKFLVLTFQAGRRTFVYDLATDRWHERESWDGGSADGTLGRWRGNCSVYCFNRWLIGDVHGNIGQLNPNVFTELGEPIPGMIIGPPLHDDRQRVFMNRFEIEVESGVGVEGASGAVTIEYCSNPVEMSKPAVIGNAGELSGVGATFATCLLSLWIQMPEDSVYHSLVWSNQDDPILQTSNPGLWIRITNHQSSTPDTQVQMLLFDASNAFQATVTWTLPAGIWTGWINFLLSIDTANQVAQLAMNNQVLSPLSSVWASSTPIVNSNAHPWQLLPSLGNVGS